MHKLQNSIAHFSFIIFVILLPLGDITLLGKNIVLRQPSYIILLIMTLLYAMPQKAVSKTAFYITIYAAVASSIFWSRNGMLFRSENLWVEFSTDILLMLPILLFLFLSVQKNGFFSAKILNSYQLKVAVKIIFFFVLLIFIYEYVIGINNISFSEWFHSDKNVQLRNRGTFLENSVSETSLIILAMTTHFLSSSKFSTVMLIFTLALVLVLGSSKGAVGSIGLGILFTLLFKRPVAFPLLIAIVFSISYELELFVYINEQANRIWTNDGDSLTTRPVLILAAFYTLLENPWGIGFGNMFPALSGNLEAAIRTFQLWSPIVKFDEIYHLYLNSNLGDHFSTKSGILDLIVVFGFMSFFPIWYYLKRLINEDDMIKQFCLIYLFCSQFTYASIENNLCSLLFLFVAVSRPINHDHDQIR